MDAVAFFDIHRSDAFTGIERERNLTDIDIAMERKRRGFWLVPVEPGSGGGCHEDDENEELFLMGLQGSGEHGYSFFLRMACRGSRTFSLYYI